MPEPASLRKVLVVETNEESKEKILKILNNNGLTSRVVSTGAEALRELHTWPAELVIIASWLHSRESIVAIIDQIKQRDTTIKSLLVCAQSGISPELAKRFDGLVRKSHLGAYLEKELRKLGFRS